MSVLMMLFRMVRGWLLLAVVAGVVSGLCNASLLAMINHGLTQSNEASWLSPGGDFALLTLLMLAARVVSQTTFMALGQKVKARLRSELVQDVSETRWLLLEKAGMARTLSVLTQDLDTLVVFFVNLPNLLIFGAVIVGCLIYLGSLSLSVLALALAVIVCGSLGYRAAHGPAMRLLRRSRQREDTLIQQCKKLFDGAREFRLNAVRRRQFVSGELAQNIDAVRRERTRGYVLYGLASSWGSALFFAFIGLVLFSLRDGLALDERALTGYIMVFLYMIVPVEGLLSALPTLAGARVAMQRVQSLRAQLRPEVPQRHFTAPPFASLALDNVRYQYQNEEGEHFTLGPLNMHIAPGELIFIVGGNGSGKTTLANLLVGIYPPDNGAILLNGEPVSDDLLEIYRRHFSVVFNDFFLFDDVAFVTERTPKQVEHLLRLLKLSHKVSFAHGRFSTIALSQGQRKRLALLQAWLEERPVYLFDEWAADQDPEFKAVFYLELLPMLKAEGKTVIAITHDDRYFYLADRIIKLESGLVVPSTHGVPS
ncbi:cyclic peptide export ABC transporter [Serratia marcescens]|uniref:cyclic peptide export ABC transporter n=1 Tax=Serratia TaxID=613 RepID=UPI000B4170B6|nr:cyclic peptide export ABC transporter [Serratia marcescens]RNW03918.1 cyclic peptide export ABC transporter [Serratia nematodiphila]ELQ9438014.1 cyclic peptide export ABC transporter [Serratia marcescens]ELT5559088.1 cyclic peptide export ABC transporter [Serratia marcescens]MBH2697237.1 cyclic peptide export ABC transporter [Serratia marcescens]